MLFTDILFIFAFIPVTLLLTFFDISVEFKNFILVISSILFFTWGIPIWLLAVFLCVFVMYFSGLYFEKSKSNIGKKIILALSIAINIGLLVFFNYGNFIVENINDLTTMKINHHINIIPIGLSFITLRAVSYIIDVFKGEIKSERSFFNLLTFITIFHLVFAGPIVRYKDISEEIHNRQIRISDLSKGFTRFILGLSKIVIICSSLDFVIQSALSHKPSSIISAWVGMFLVVLKIYYYLSGFSDMAIGLGNMNGFNYPENFGTYFIGNSITGTYKRFNMTFVSFLKDYIFDPLNKKKMNIVINILLLGILAGIWYGVGFNFLLFGLFFSVFIILEKKLFKTFFDKMPQAISIIYTVFILMLGFSLFHYSNLSDFINFIKTIFFVNGVSFIDKSFGQAFLANLFIIIVAVVFAFPIGAKIKQKVLAFSLKSHSNYGTTRIFQTLVSLILLAVCTIMTASFL